MASPLKPKFRVTNRTARLVMRIHPELLEAVRSAAEGEHVTVSRWVTAWLETGVAAARKPKK